MGYRDPTPAAIIAVATAALATAAGCESKVTQTNYDQVKVGMNESEVEALLGKGEDDTSGGGISITGGGVAGSVKVPGEKITVWKDNGKKIVVTFLAGKAIDKRQEGL